MNEIAVRETGAQLADYRSSAMQRLGEWAESAQAAHQVATQLVQTSFVPEAFRGNPGEATAAILAGSEVGLSPMASLRSFDIIQGTAAPRAITLRAIVQSLGHDIILEESTATRCKVRARRSGTSEWQTVVWTTDRAKGLNLLGKHNWKAQPQAMLVARATSEAARLIAADAILGIPYSAEEIADGAAEAGSATATPPTQQPSGTRRMSRPQRSAPQGDGGAEASPVASDAADEEPQGSGDGTAPTSTETPMITPAQTRKIGVLMRDAELTDRSAALAYAGQVIGREIGSRNELTKREAGQVIDQLEADAAALDAVTVDDESESAEDGPPPFSSDQPTLGDPDAPTP